VDFAFSDDLEEFRRQVKNFLARELSEEMLERCLTSGTLHDDSFHRALAAQGWLDFRRSMVEPDEELDPIRKAILFEEFHANLAPLFGLKTTTTAALALREHAHPEVRDQMLDGIAAGDVVVCLGFSEAGSGSDIAAARTRALRDGGSWLINGEKVFTSSAEIATHVLLLARTSPDKPKHQGLTTFLIPMNAPGIEVRPVHTMSERSNITVYTNVILDDYWRIGEVDRGWEVITDALTDERGGDGFQGHMRRLLNHAVDWKRSHQSDGPASDFEEIGRFAAYVEAVRTLDFKTAWLSAQGSPETGVSGSMTKLLASEKFTDACARFMTMLGPEGVIGREDPEAPQGGWIEHLHRFAAPTTVYGGSSEIQRSIIAERVLGLPRSR